MASTTKLETMYDDCITSYECSVLERTNSYMECTLEIRQKGGVFLPVDTVEASDSAGGKHTFDPFLIVPTNSDVRLVATANSAGIDVSGSIQGYLASVMT